MGKLYHKGELAVQRRANTLEKAKNTGQIVSQTMAFGALEFIQQQPMVVIGSISEEGEVWASILFGKPGFGKSELGETGHMNPGFLYAPDERTLVIDVSRSSEGFPLCINHNDPLWENLKKDTDVGLLVIDLGTRHRLRINGKIKTIDEKNLIIAVERSYGNCPKFIQRRHWSIAEVNTSRISMPDVQGSTLGVTQRNLIAQADTFFVASAMPGHGVDASHRGGLPGFVQVLNAHTLYVPDFAGNSMFNTLGNFESYPHAGLVFIDFAQGRVLQLTGRPEIIWEIIDTQENTLQDNSGGAYRFWKFEITSWRESTPGVHLTWELEDYSPFLLASLKS